MFKNRRSFTVWGGTRSAIAVLAGGAADEPRSGARRSCSSAPRASSGLRSLFFRAGLAKKAEQAARNAGFDPAFEHHVSWKSVNTAVSTYYYLDEYVGILRKSDDTSRKREGTATEEAAAEKRAAAEKSCSGVKEAKE